MVLGSTGVYIYYIYIYTHIHMVFALDHLFHGLLCVPQNQKKKLIKPSLSATTIRYFLTTVLPRRDTHVPKPAFRIFYSSTVG